MNSRINSCGLHLFCFGLLLLAGCFPEESLDWSTDGSIGLYMTGGRLCLVDGRTGALSPNSVDKVLPWPGISPDGKKVVYAVQVKHATLAEGLKSLPAEQAGMIAADAKSLRDKILSGAVKVTDFNAVERAPGAVFGDESVIGYVEPYRQWIVRSLCENADEQLAERLGARLLQQGKTAELRSCALIVAAVPDIENGRIITTSALNLFRPRFAPDNRYVAYLLQGPAREEQAHLVVAPAQPGSSPVYVASNVSLGFDWRQDSQTLAYLQWERQELPMLGTLREQRVCDPNGKLLDATSDHPEMPLAAHHLKDESRQLAGTFVEPLMRVQYGPGGRLFFSSASARIPSSDLDEPSYSLFCYDFVTGGVADVLPARARNEQPVGETVNFFALSPDGKKVLLPLKKNRLVIYALGTSRFTTPVEESEEFGSDLGDLLPAWKGNDRISCLVSPKSHFLTEEQKKRGRNAVVELNAAGNLETVLSTTWPDDALSKD